MLLLMRSIRRYFKIIGYFLLVLIAFILLYLLTEWILSRIPVAEEEGHTEDMTVYIIHNGAHTDIVMPVRSAVVDWSEHLPYEDTKGKDSSLPFVGVGWGDKGFYLETETWADLKVSVALKAAFGLGNTAMHTTYYRSMVPGERCRAISISYRQYERLVLYVLSSFRTDEKGRFSYINTDKQYGGNDAFYDAKRSYSMLYTCNTWANNALKAAGLRACYWTAFYRGIFKKHPLTQSL